MKGDQFGGPIRWRLHLPVRPERVFETLASDQGRASFWAEAAVEHHGVIEFRFSGGESCSSRILEREPPRRFTLEYFGSVAQFDLESDGQGGTDLLLTNTGVSEQKWNEVHTGWLNVLLSLKAWLVRAVDLRNHDASRNWDTGYADS